MNKNLKENLLPFNAIIQICPVCGKIDVYKDDGHICNVSLQAQLEQEWDD